MYSRYGIIPSDLRIYAQNLSIGEGIANRLGGADAIRFIVDAERWVEAQVSAWIAVPLQPVGVPQGVVQLAVPEPPPFAPGMVAPSGSAAVSNWPPEVAVTPQGRKWNYPIEFIQAIIYEAIAKMLRSEFFEAEPNVSQSAEYAESESYKYIIEFRSRPTTLVGAGRRRNPNPHMPPNIAPPETSGVNSFRTGS